MSDTDIRVRTLIAEELGRPLASVVPATLVFEDLGLSTEDLSYLVAEIETAFGITLDVTGPRARLTVGALIRLVEGELAGFTRRARR